MIVTTVATADTRASAATVFDVANDIDDIAEAFVSFGPIPGVARGEVIGGGPLAEGKTRRLQLTDGSMVEEDMLLFDRPRAFSYTLRGIGKPFGLLVRQGKAHWMLTESAAGTHVHWQYNFELTSALAWPVAGPLLHLLFNAWMRRCLGRITDLAVRASTGVEKRRSSAAG
jgi:hypothetical protein